MNMPMDESGIITTFGKCRCCSIKGSHRNIMKEYYYHGLSTDANMSTLICSECVQRLRDANAFRTMVANSEREMTGSIVENHTFFVNVSDQQALQSEVDIKTEPLNEVKEESIEDGTMQDDFDDLDITYPDPVNEDLVPGEMELLKRFSGKKLKPLPTRQTLYDVCPKFTSHLDCLRGRLITAKMLANMFAQERERSNKIYITEKLGQISNTATILECSNVVPFKGKNRTGFPCFYCRCIYDSSSLRQHQNKEHKKTEARKILSTYGVECLVLYVDVTDLKCTLCDQNQSNLNELKSHLIKQHKKTFYTDFTDRVIPFKLSSSNIYECQICGFNFETFGSIERHMNVHFRNYVCKDCGTGFVTKYRLKVHMKSMHVDGNYPCDVCNKVFTTQQKQKNHVDAVHKLVKRFKCTKCPERFSEYFKRQKHMVSVHGVAPLQYKCNVCDKSFDRRYTLSRHLKRDHLEERDYQCELCSYKCFTNNELRVHMVKHNGERIFECSVCKKSYARKKTLKEHMRIHDNDRRFACSVCGQAFVQKCSLKGHLKTHHLEFALQRDV